MKSSQQPKEYSRILMTVGGTGGHIFPATALAEDLIKEDGCTVLFAGGKLSQNPYFDKEHLAFKDVECIKVSGSMLYNPWQMVKNSIALFKGVKESISIIRDFKPDLVVGFGSYYTLPVLIAAKLLRKPIFLHEANSVPGKVNRLFSPYVEKTLVHFPSAQELLKGKSALGGMPLRSEFRKGKITKEEARRSFQLALHLPTILVFGGSQGAHRINALFSEAALFHLKDLMPPFQVLHFTGNHKEAEQLMARYVCAEIPAYVRPFEKRMAQAWAAADIAITRAGAASIAEQIEYEVPGILVPYPHATDQHQDKNADFLVSTGLAMKVSEDGLTPQGLAGKVQELYLHYKTMQKEFAEYKKKNLSVSLANLITDWIGTQNKKPKT